ncbi:MAG: translation initiation factor [Planctomycetaceae bacterium]|nr:translation initiation factor [Planctomycetaceae bacterium]
MRLFEGTPFDRPPRCEHCGELEEECRCPPPEPICIPPEKQTARIGLEKRKNGKRVTVIQGLPVEGNDLPALLASLKSHCGAGGTLKDGELEIQGEQLDRVRQKLLALGFKVRG